MITHGSGQFKKYVDEICILKDFAQHLVFTNVHELAAIGALTKSIRIETRAYTCDSRNAERVISLFSRSDAFGLVITNDRNHGDASETSMGSYIVAHACLHRGAGATGCADGFSHNVVC